MSTPGALSLSQRLEGVRRELEISRAQPREGLGLLMVPESVGEAVDTRSQSLKHELCQGMSHTQSSRTPAKWPGHSRNRI